MSKTLFNSGWGLSVGLGLVAAGGLLCAFSSAQTASRECSRAVDGRARSGQPWQRPAFTIAVEPLGFTAAGAFYLGQRNSLASLDFLDEDRLLFTFRVPRLIRREARENETGESKTPENETEKNDAVQERPIRALLLALPAGTVAAEALWTVHDQARYLWMLKDGHFLLRDRNNLEQGDATLEVKPFLHFSGPLLWMEMDPGGEFLVSDSREPEAVRMAEGGVFNPLLFSGKPDEPGRPDEQKSPAGSLEPPKTPSKAAVGVAVESQRPVVQSNVVVRILRRDSGQVILSSRAGSAVHLPINADGYLESEHARGNEWLMQLKYFRGGSTILGRVQSNCTPVFDFLSQREVLVTTCLPSGTDKLLAMTTEGRRLWEDPISKAVDWSLLVRSPDGLRLAREALVASPAVKSRLLSVQDQLATQLQDQIKGQQVQVLDAADGKVVLETYTTPALDAGGNVAISPSGCRVAVLNDGAIQVFDLPSPPPLPNPGSN
jgi:hypothetical protein